MDKLSDSKHQVERLAERASFLYKLTILTLPLDFFALGGALDGGSPSVASPSGGLLDIPATIGLIICPLFLLDHRLVSEKLALLRDSLLRGKLLRPVIIIGLFILIGLEVLPKFDDLWIALPAIAISIWFALKPAERAVREVLKKLGTKERDRLKFLDFFITQQFRYYLLTLMSVRVISFFCASSSEPLVIILPYYVIFYLTPPKYYEPCPKCYELRPTALGWYPGCEKCSY